jgi:hypothetical protein
LGVEAEDGDMGRGIDVCWRRRWLGNRCALRRTTRSSRMEVGVGTRMGSRRGRGRVRGTGWVRLTSSTDSAASHCAGSRSRRR